MQSARFGVAWIIHQTLPRLAFSSVDTITTTSLFEQEESALIVTYALGYVMPCRFCRDSYRGFSSAAQLYEQLGQPFTPPAATARPESLRANHEHYWTRIHNMVNAKLHKPLIDEKDDLAVTRAYELCVAKSPCEFVGALLEWLQMLALNYNNIETKQPPITTPAQRIAARHVRRGASCSANAGYFLAKARRRGVPLNIVIDEFARDNKPPNVIIGGKHHNETIDDDDTEWLKVVWYTFYIAHLTAIMQRSSDSMFRQCATALRSTLDLGNCGKHTPTFSSSKPVGANFDHSEPFLSSDTLFEALQTVRQQCLPETCRATLAADREAYEQCRASLCSAGKCV